MKNIFIINLFFSVFVPAADLPRPGEPVFVFDGIPPGGSRSEPIPPRDPTDQKRHVLVLQDGIGSRYTLGRPENTYIAKRYVPSGSIQESDGIPEYGHMDLSAWAEEEKIEIYYVAISGLRFLAEGPSVAELKDMICHRLNMPTTFTLDLVLARLGSDDMKYLCDLEGPGVEVHKYFDAVMVKLKELGVAFGAKVCYIGAGLPGNNTSFDNFHHREVVMCRQPEDTRRDVSSRIDNAQARFFCVGLRKQGIECWSSPDRVGVLMLAMISNQHSPSGTGNPADHDFFTNSVLTFNALEHALHLHLGHLHRGRFISGSQPGYPAIWNDEYEVEPMKTPEWITLPQGPRGFLANTKKFRKALPVG